MAGKKKTQKRKQLQQTKRHRQQLEQLSEEEARCLVEALLVQGKPREALQTLQQLPFGDAPDFLLLKAEAYGWRARQLQGKGLAKEAETVLDLLRRHLAGMPAVTDRQIARVIAATPAAFGIRYYRQHRQRYPDCPQLESALANLLVVSDQWDLLKELPADHILHRDGLLMAKAAAEFAQARWQAGLALLEPLPRKSPFASWKLFGKAMLSAVTGAEEDLHKALRRLPPDFPLRETTAILSQQGCAGLAAVREQISRPSEVETQGLLAAIKSGDRRLPALIEHWSRERFPQYGDMAVRCVSELAALLLVNHGYDGEDIEDLLPGPSAEPICLRLEMFLQTVSDVSAQPFCVARHYLQAVKPEFAGVVEYEQLQAVVYSALLSRVLGTRRAPRDLRAPDRACLQWWLPDYPVAERDLFVAAADKILRLAPTVPAYHHLLKEFDLRDLSREAKTLLEKTLLGVRVRFPEDPFPYVQLARLYWSQNAHRKAQKILEEAWQQAPYDPQVREYYSLGLLRATVMARRRRAYHLARRDLNAALELGVKDLLPLGQAIQATMDYLESDGDETVADALLASPDALLRYRLGIYFYLDLLTLGGAARSFAAKVKTKLHNQLRKNLTHLSGRELMAILAPLNEAYSSFFGPFNPITFFSSLTPRIVASLNDREVLTIYAQILGPTAEAIQIKWVRNDLEDRLRKAPDDVFLRFYKSLIQYLLKPFVGAAPFEELLHSLDKSETEALHEFCCKIAPYFQAPLRTALSFLDFSALEGHRREWFEPEEEWEDEEELDAEDGVDAPSLENIIEIFQAMGKDTGAVEFFFEMLLEMVQEQEVTDDKVRELGLALQERAPQLVQKLRRMYSGKRAERLGRTGRLMLFPEGSG